MYTVFWLDVFFDYVLKKKSNLKISMTAKVR
jgi:hypothetical protein